MALRFAIESWAPEYGSPFEAPDTPDQHGAEVDVGVECPAAAWAPRPPAGGAASRVLFIDGVRRLDARLWVDIEGASRLGLCASLAAGVVRSDGGAARLVHASVRRVVVGPAGLEDIVTPVGTYQWRTSTATDFEGLSTDLQDALGSLEQQMAAAADGADLVMVDGSLSGRQNVPGAVGYIKSHHAQYLQGAQAAVVAALAPGERTPVFLTRTSWSRYSWYLRLPGGSGHPWAGVVRCEAASTLSAAQAVRCADLCAATLPRFASEPHKETRAPQNLYPVSGLERDLRRRLGDQHLLFRALLQASRAGSAAITP